mgnify:CR=1 FL=1
MNALEDLTRTLDRLLDAGELTGWAVGVADADGASVRVGGTRSPGGAPMTPDTQVALSSSTKPIGGVLALRLVELAALSLDEPVAPWLPELAEPRVLVGPEADLTATVPAERPITLRHLLTMTPGFGWVSEPGPLADALAREQVAPGPFCPPMSPDDFMSRLGSVPLVPMLVHDFSFAALACLPVMSILLNGLGHANYEFSRSAPARIGSLSQLDAIFTEEMVAGGYRKKYLRATSRLLALSRFASAEVK